MANKKNICIGHENATEPYEIFDCPYHLAELLSDKQLIDEVQKKAPNYRIIIISGREPDVKQLIAELGYNLD